MMGGKGSKGSGRREYPSHGSSGSSSWNQYGYPQTSYPEQNPYYTPQHQHASPPSTSFNYGSQPSFNYRSEAPRPQKKLDRRYSRIADNYRSLDEVRQYAACDFLFFKASSFVFFGIFGLRPKGLGE